MPETTPLIKAALNLRVGVGFDVYELYPFLCNITIIITISKRTHEKLSSFTRPNKNYTN